MTIQAVCQFLTSFVALLGINAVPADLVLLKNNSAATAMVLYYLEAILAVLFAAARVRILAPADDQSYAELGTDTLKTGSTTRVVPRTRQRLITEYILAPSALWFVLGIFIFLILFVFGGAKVPGSVILSGMAWIIAFQLFSFVADLFLLGRVTPAQAENILRNGMGRVALIFFAVFLGVLTGMVNTNWFILPFIALKTLADLVATVQTFRTHLRLSKSR